MWLRTETVMGPLTIEMQFNMYSTKNEGFD